MPAQRYLVLAVTFLTMAACGETTPMTGAPDRTAASAGPVSAASAPARRGAAGTLPDGYDAARDAKADIAAALAKAKADGHPVLLDFGANWCPDCAVLEKTFRSDTVRPVIGGFHVVAVDVGRFDRHLGLARTYHLDLRTSGIPALVVLSPNGRVRTTTSDGSFANARTMTPGQVATILKHWR